MTGGAGSRLAAAFERARNEGRPALITYVIPGSPAAGEAEDIFDAMIEGGADIIELGIPFSDPLADGATMQRASFQALQSGTTPASCLEFARQMRTRHPRVPIVFMSYLNPVIAYGLEAFARDLAGAGADGLILVDLPPEEAASAKQALERNGLAFVCLAAPTSTDERLRAIAEAASGYIYCVSVAGVTGARANLPPTLPDFLARVRRCTSLPLAVGFGVSRREHVEALSRFADGVIVASAIFDLIAATRREERAKVVREYVEVLSGRREPPS